MTAGSGGQGFPPRGAVAPFTGVLGEPPPPSSSSRTEALGRWLRGVFRSASRPGLPAAFSWDDKGVVPAPGDQGALAACVSYAACLAASISHRVKTGRSIGLAPRVMHLCTMGLDPGLGTNSYELEERAMAVGLPVVDPAQAAVAAGMASTAQCGAFGGVGRLKVTGVRRFQTADEVKTELCRVGPVVVHMQLFDDFWRSYIGGTVYRAPAGASSAVTHAVCLVGYDDSRQCWIGVNSRGVGWGSQGRFLLGYGECGVMASGATAYALAV